MMFRWGGHIDRGYAGREAIPFNPPSVPLDARSPTYHHGIHKEVLSGQWPSDKFSGGQVDRNIYVFGDPSIPSVLWPKVSGSLIDD